LAQFDSFGRLVRYFDKKQDREILEAGSFGNVYKYYEDIPLFWDAWDVEVYHLEKGWEVNQLDASVVTDSSFSPHIGKIQFTLRLSEKSSLVCVVSLSASSNLLKFECDVDWNENRRFLVRFSSFPFKKKKFFFLIFFFLLFSFFFLLFFLSDSIAESGVSPQHSI
jgi:alpha-mannosidase